MEPACGNLRSFLEPEFGNLRSSPPASKSAFCDHWTTAVFGQILAGRSLLEQDFGNLQASRPASKSAFWDYWEMGVLGQILTGSLLELWRLLEASGKPLGSLWEASGKPLGSSGQTPGNRRAAASSARRPENTKAQAFFKARFSQSDASSRTPFLVTLKLYFAFLTLGTSF